MLQNSITEKFTCLNYTLVKNGLMKCITLQISMRHSLLLALDNHFLDEKSRI